MEKKIVYGTRHAAKVLGVTRLEMLEAAVIDDCPSVCSACGQVNESGHEPDASKYDCEGCGAVGTVNSVLVVAGFM